MTNDTKPIQYLLTIRQQPSLSMVIVSSPRERRSIEPCPIIEMKIIRPDGTELNIMDLDEDYLLSAHLYDKGGKKMNKPIKALVHANGDQQSASSNETTLRAPLAGSTVSSLHRVKGLDNEQMSIFYFPDLKVWIAGQFYLHFQLFYLPKKDTPHSLPTECVASVVSNEFTVFPVKEFPGVYESTPLSKHLKAQGLFISIRNKDRLKASKEDSGAAVESENSDDPPVSESPPFEPRS